MSLIQGTGDQTLPTVKLMQYHVSGGFLGGANGKESACQCRRHQFSHLVVSDSLQPHGLQYAKLPSPSPTPRACSNSCPSSQWCHPIIASSVIPFSSCLQSSPASGSLPMSQFFVSGGQSIGASASASVLPMNTFIHRTNRFLFLQRLLVCCELSLSSPYHVSVTKMRRESFH